MLKTKWFFKGWLWKIFIPVSLVQLIFACPESTLTFFCKTFSKGPDRVNYPCWLTLFSLRKVTAEFPWATHLLIYITVISYGMSFSDTWWTGCTICDPTSVSLGRHPGWRYKTPSSYFLVLLYKWEGISFPESVNRKLFPFHFYCVDKLTIILDEGNQWRISYYLES